MGKWFFQLKKKKSKHQPRDGNVKCGQCKIVLFHCQCKVVK